MSSLIRLGISGGLLGLIAWKTNWSEFARAFGSLDVGWWSAAVALIVISQFISAIRWREIARAFGFNWPFKRLLAFYFIGMYFNLCLPTSVGGDVVRAWYLDGRSGRRLNAFLCVFLDRFSGLLALIMLACVAVLASPVPLESWIAWSVWGMALGAMIGVMLMPTVARWVRFGEPRVQKIRAALGVLRQPGLFVRTTALSFVVQALSVLTAWLVGVALDAPVPPSFYWVLVPMVSLLTMLPSINGMGIRELSMTVLLGAVGVKQDIAVPLALLWFAATGVVSLAGGLVYLFSDVPRPERSLSVEEFDNGSVDRHSDQGRTRQPRAAA